MLGGRLIKNNALERISRIRSEMDKAFDKGSIDFDIIDSELESLAGDIESIVVRLEPDNQEGSVAATSPKDFVPRSILKLEDYR